MDHAKFCKLGRIPQKQKNSIVITYNPPNLYLSPVFGYIFAYK